MESNKITIEKARDFGEVLTDSAILFFKSWKPLLWSMAYITLPFFLVAFVIYYMALSDFNGVAMEDAIMSAVYAFSGVAVIFLLASLATQLMVIALVEVYRQKGDYAKDVSEFWEVLRPVLGKMIGIGFLIWLLPAMLVMLGFLLMFASPIAGGIFLGIAAISILWYINSAIYASFIAIRYQVSIWDSIKKALQLTQNQWWVAFGFMILLGIIVNTFHSLIFLPFTIAQVIENFSAISKGTNAEMPKTAFTLLSMFQIAVYIVFNGYSTICFNLKYYDLLDNRYGSNLESRINNIGKTLVDELDE
ncbi:MAG: hypothetical protein U0V54_03705 [Saprospiraceae bacterium]